MRLYNVYCAVILLGCGILFGESTFPYLPRDIKQAAQHLEDDDDYETVTEFAQQASGVDAQSLDFLLEQEQEYIRFINESRFALKDSATLVMSFITFIYVVLDFKVNQMEGRWRNIVNIEKWHRSFEALWEAFPGLGILNLLLLGASLPKSLPETQYHVTQCSLKTERIAALRYVLMPALQKPTIGKELYETYNTCNDA